MNNRYESPLSMRYASAEMTQLFSADSRYTTWRKLWVSLARAERALGLPITQEQIDALTAHVSDIDYRVVREREKIVRHDVMAHIYAYGLAAPEAAGIIHLGATSCFVTDNADLILYRDALHLIRKGVVRVIARLSAFAEAYKHLPTPGYTHYQAAQFVTVGKRACLWTQDFVSDLADLDFLLAHFPFLGCRGATGTEASFLALFDGDGGKVDEMNRRIAADFGFTECFSVCGQTYPRKTDSRILNVLSLIAQSAYRMAEDIRLLQHDGQLEEPFGTSQVGSSAMAYKRNPVRCERICSLARYVMNDAANAAQTAAVQWLERSLDDSAIRRIAMPEGFLACNAILRLADSVIGGLTVKETVIAAATDAELPRVATENLLMAAVRQGADRQRAHEVIRRAAMGAKHPSDLLGMLANEPELHLTPEQIQTVLDPAAYTGRCVEQVERFLEKTAALTADADCTPDNIDV
ncbi:MAG: adenylosuccinate lyase [Oscillospiraceae bacterium]|nr:adenylosuccinate lyase [Oscillospiraceae bacterium]